MEKAIVIIAVLSMFAVSTIPCSSLNNRTMDTGNSLYASSDDLSLNGTLYMHMPNLEKYGNQYYLVSRALLNGSIYCSVLDEYFNVKDIVHVGDIESTIDPHCTPFVAITRKGEIHVAVGYGMIYHWSASYDNMTFIGGFIGSAMQNYCYPMLFVINDTCYAFMRCAYTSSYKIVDMKTHSATNTIWTWQEGPLRDSCYYCAVGVYDNKLYVTGVGARNDEVLERRSNLYFGITEDLRNWYSIDGYRITEPEIIYEGSTSRCGMSIDEYGNPLVAMSYIEFYNDVSRYFIVLRQNGKWENRELPIPPIERGTISSGIPVRIGNEIHLITATQNSTADDRTSDVCKIIHYWSDPPFQVWNIEYITDEFDSYCGVATYLFGDALMFRSKSNGEYVSTIIGRSGGGGPRSAIFLR